MNILRRFNERREHKRHCVENDSYAAISPDSKKLGRIVNISKGGLAFEYFVNYGSEISKPNQTIYLSSNGCYVENIPFKVIEDREVANNLPFNSMEKRKQRVQFGTISHRQSFDLDFYIQNNTVNSPIEPQHFMHEALAY